MDQQDVFLLDLEDHQKDLRDVMDFDMDLDVETLEMAGAFGEARGTN